MPGVLEPVEASVDPRGVDTSSEELSAEGAGELSSHEGKGDETITSAGYGGGDDKIE